MATATSFTSARMLEIERASVVSARRENGELILTTRGGTDINVGDVTGSQGPPGPDGSSRYTWLKYADSPTTGMSDNPTNKNYIGLAYNKTTPIESNDYADYAWTLIRGPEGQQGVPGPPGDDGEPTYVWIKYATDATGAGMSDSPTNKDYIGFAYNKSTPVESTNPADYAWSLIKGPKGDKGEDGADGLPGPAGADGLPNYTWLKYATTPTTGMSDDPTGKDYIGLAYNKGTSTESTDYADYQWSLIKGPQGNQGVPGTPGADGQPRYVWIKYANTVAGDGMSDDPTGKDYIGLAYNKTTAVESTQPLDYTWSLYKGPPGADGEDGRGITSSEITYQASWSGVLVPTGTWLADPPVLSPGQYLWTRTKTNYNAAPYEVMSYSVGQMGQTGAPGADGTTITAAVVRYQLHTNGVTPPTGTWLFDPPAGSPGQWFWTRTVTSYNSGGDTVAYSVALLGQTGPPGADGAAGVDGEDGRGITSSEIRYQGSSSGTTVPTGTWLTDPPTLSAGQFLWTRTRTFYTSAPTEVVSYSVGQMGATGSQGIQGPSGTSYYTWLKYADSPTTGMSDDPTGKTYIGLAHNKTTATESTDYGDYTWAVIKGEQGVQGPPGTDGQPTYTWIKYGTSSSGAGISDDPTGKTYIGIAYNKTTIVESSNPLDYVWSLIQGAAGAPGESVTGQTVQYQLSSSGTVIPAGTWVNSPPTGSPGQYMWTRITFSYSTLPDSYAYSVAMLGNTGPAGTPAAVINLIATSQVLRSPAAGGVTTPATATVTGTATNTTISVWEYSVNGGVFSATVPDGVSRTGNVVTITGDTMTAVTIAVRMADANGIAQSVTVSKIYDGAIGPEGNTGRGISSTEIRYQAGTSGTVVPTGTWLTDPPSVSAGQYLWTRTVFNYTSGSPANTTHYSVGGMGSKIDTVTTTYQLSNSGTVAPTGTWLTDPPAQTDALPFLWTRTITTYIGGPSNSTAYSVARRGVGVASVEMIYKALTPLVWDSFEDVSGTTVEVFRNYHQNPKLSVDATNYYSSSVTARLGVDLEDYPNVSFAFKSPANSNVAATRPAVATLTGLTAGKVYTAMLLVLAKGASWQFGAWNGVLNAFGVPPTMGARTLAADNDWRIEIVTFTAGSTSASVGIYALAAMANTEYGITRVSVVEGPAGLYFDGDYSTDNDLEPHWSGAENASQSILTAHVPYPDPTVQNINAISSIQWFKTGSTSLRQIPNSSTQNSSYNSRLLSDYALEVGKSYTVGVTLRMTAPQTGSLHALARTIGLNVGSLKSDAALNAAGESFLSFQFTIDGTTVTLAAALLFYNGAYLGNGNTWWDDLLIIEGNVGSDIASWTNTMPSYDAEMVLYRSEKVTFTDGTISYSPPKIEPLWDALHVANDARNNADIALSILDDHSLILYGDDDGSGLVNRLFLLENDTGENPSTALGALIRSIGLTANGKNTIIRSLSGAINPQKNIAGDQWYQYNSSGQIVNFWMHDGNDWVETKLNGVIFGTVDAGVINSGYINADRIALNSIPRDKIDNLPQLLADLQSVSGSGEVSQAVRDLLSSIEIGTGVIKIITPGISESTSYRMELRSNKLAFMRGDTETASISDDTLLISNAKIATEIGDSLVFAAHDVFKGGTSTLAGKVTVFRSI